MRNNILLLLVAVITATFTITAQENTNPDTTSKFNFESVEKFRNTKLKGTIVNDYDSIFTETQIQELSTIIYNYNEKTTRQIVVVSIDSIAPYTDIVQYATDLSNYWAVGAKNKNNGLTMVVCMPCRQIGIATGTGTQTVLTNEICSEVIQSVIIPELKKGEPYQGIKKGITQFIEKWE